MEYLMFKRRKLATLEKLCHRGATVFAAFGVGGSSSTVRFFGEMQDKIQVRIHLGDDEVVAVEEFG